MKRIAVLLVALALLAKPAGAFVGVPLLFAPPVVTTVGGGVMATWAAIAGGVGALLYSVGLRDDQGNEFLRLRMNPNAPQVVPPGWSAGTAGNDPNPPSTAPQVVTGCSWFLGSITGAYADGQSCVSALIAPSGPNGGCQHLDCDPASGDQPGSCACAISGCASGSCTVSIDGFATHNTPSAGYSQSCPAGYSASGPSCVLSNPPAVRFPPDDRCGLTFSGGVMSYDSRDPDCDGTSPPGIQKSTDGKTLTVSNPQQQIKIEVATDGSVKITTWSPSTTDPTKTQVQQVTVATPGTTTAQSRGTQNTVVNGVGDPAFQVQPTAGSSPFPDDYSREVTQQSVAQKLTTVNTKLDTLHGDLTTRPDRPVDPPTPEPSLIEGVFFPDTFVFLRSWTLPARGVACPTWSFSAFSHGYTIDAHCPLIENQRTFFSAIMLLVWGLIAMFVVLGA